MNRDLFEKCGKFTAAKDLMSLGLYPYFRAIEDSNGNFVSSHGKKRVMIGSNNYLGLTHHPRVMEAAKNAIDQFGTGCTGSRFLNGNLTLHEELEANLEAFLEKEKVLVYSTGFQANLGSISCLCGKNDVIFSDSENHASIIESMRSSFAKVIKYPHNDVKRLEELLERNAHKFHGILIVFDGVFSMTGDIVNLPEIIRVAKKYNARLYCDDAHSIGVLGPKGEGTGHHFGLQKDVDLVMGTFSKSFASIGGFVAGSEEVIHYIKHNSRSFIFSASMPPAAVATVLECLKIIQEEPEHLQNLWKNVKKMREGFKALGFQIGNTQTPVIPILIGDDMKAFMMTKALYEKGIFATPVVSPGVPPGEALIRTSYMATHTESELNFVLDVFADLKKEFNIEDADSSRAEVNSFAHEAALEAEQPSLS